MERGEQIGLGVAIVAHALLFVILSSTLLVREEIPRREAVSVVLTDNIGETSTARDRPAAAARPSPESIDRIEPLPLPDVIPTPQPSVSPAPRPSTRPTERVRPRQRERPRQTQREASGPVDRGDRRRADNISSSRPNRMAGITDGISASNDSGTSSSQAPVGASDQASLISAITRHVRRCYNLGAMGGTAAEDIIVSLRLQPSRNGSISGGQISVRSTRGVNGSNRQYERQMQEAARSAVLSCGFPDLPDNMYENGWSDVVLNFIPAQLT
ncbi:MAG: hypothetical protein RLN87_08845 [Parasphingopyxis sp.]|uniref:hypothetical protein n=1 Tax=Parasphingopyxis sp. TaxID=1920299 RepID=UPI002617DC71|nr:hypothetical protein [uncultured Parasphingopyxis sp.]